MQVPAGGGREAIWGAEGTAGLEAEVLLDGDLVGFVPEIPGSETFDEAQIVDAIARTDYDEPVGRELPEAPPPGTPLPPRAAYSAASSRASATTPRPPPTDRAAGIDQPSQFRQKPNISVPREGSDSMDVAAP